MQTSGPSRASAAAASATEPAPEASYPSSFTSSTSASRAPGSSSTTRTFMPVAPPSRRVRRPGHERSATSRPSALDELEASPVGFDARAGEEEILGPLLAARQVEEPLGVRLAAPAEGLDPEGHPPRSGLLAQPRRRPAGSRERRNHTRIRRASMVARRRSRSRGRDAESSSSGDPGDAAEIAERGLRGRLARDARETRQEVDEPAGGGEVGLRSADPVREGRAVRRNRREATLEELELHPRGRERVGQGVPERSERTRHAAGEVRRKRLVHLWRSRCKASACEANVNEAASRGRSVRVTGRASVSRWHASCVRMAGRKTP